MSFFPPHLTPKQKRFALINLVLGLVLAATAIIGFVHGYRLANKEFLLVLTFHGVVDQPERPWEIDAPKLAVYLDDLRKYGFEPLPPDAFEAWWKGTAGGGRKFLLTFDDGLSSSGKAIRDLLKSRGIRPVLFVITDLVGTMGYLTWQELKDLADSGCLIGLHGKKHEEMPTLLSRGENLAEQTAEAVQTMRARLATAPTWFAYPFGEVNPEVRNIIASAGLTFAFTIAGAPVARTQDPLQLPRLMYLRGVEQTGEQGLSDWIPPTEIRNSGLILTLAMLVFLWSLGLLYRFYVMARPKVALPPGSA